MSIKRRNFGEKNLILVESGGSSEKHHPPLQVGERVRLAVGVMELLVVDAPADGDVTVAWESDCGEVHELELPGFAFERLD